MSTKNTLVNFLICGTQKGGTTALDHYLRQHPEICMANEKEVHFFDTDAHFSSIPNYSIYHSSFNPNENHRILGESTPIYMYWNAAPKRISQYNPEMKIILLLRNPIERAYSHWNMEFNRGNEKLPFFEALKKEERNLGNCTHIQDRIRSYVDRGYYVAQILRLWEYFPKHQTLILKSENLKENPRETLEKIYDFLNIDLYFDFNYHQQIHSIPYGEILKEVEQTYLLNIFTSEIEKLETLMHWDCSNWLTR